MRDIKFDIKIKHIETGNTFREVFTLDEIISGSKLYAKGIQEVVFKRQFTGLKDNNKRDVCEQDIYSETDQGRKMLFIVTWINEYAAFAMLTPIEFEEYKKIGVEVIEKSFEGFYVQLHRESFQKMKYEGNVYENPELLS